ncbi:hypothetical protein H8E88_33390 [candidate division KSB1 bacterium]|nr:hypothetical protein [candidate division KSB1 bacterium]
MKPDNWSAVDYTFIELRQMLLLRLISYCWLGDSRACHCEEPLAGGDEAISC